MQQHNGPYQGTYCAIELDIFYSYILYELQIHECSTIILVNSVLVC